jgi:hypothetical protein
MNCKVKRVLLVGTVVLGISAMISHDATAQLFRGRGGLRNRCQPVCCTTYNQASYHGYAGTAYGSASRSNHQHSDCCAGTSTSGMYSSGMSHSDSQYQQESFDSQGNRIYTGTQWNNQQHFDAQGNRIDAAIQLNNQQHFDAQGNRIDAAIQSNLDGTQIDINANQSGVPGSTDAGVDTTIPVPRDR